MGATLPTHVKKLYLAAPKEHRKTMLELRAKILKAAPNAEEVVSYGMPAFKVNGEVVAGIMAAKAHVGYYPFSGSTLAGFKRELARYRTTKSAIHVPVGEPLSQALVSKLIRARISQCKVSQGGVDLSIYESKDGVWRELGIAAPARRGLIDKKIMNLKQLARITEAQFDEIHAMGPKASAIIKAEMKRKKIRFKL